MSAEKLKLILRRLLTVGLMFFLFSVTQAQESSTTIELNNGEKISGTILEAIPDQYVKIELADKTVRTVQAADIKSITTSVEKKKKESKAKLSVIGSIGAAYDVTTGRGFITAEPRIIVGLRLKNVRLGLGAGYMFGLATQKTPEVNPEDIRLFSKYFHLVPLFLNVHTEFTNKKIKPCFDISLGYPIAVSKSPNQEFVTYSWSYPRYDQDDYVVKLGTAGRIYTAIGVGFTAKVSEKLYINPALSLNFTWFAEKMEGSKTASFYDGYSGTWEPYTFFRYLDETTERYMTSPGISIRFIY